MWDGKTNEVKDLPNQFIRIMFRSKEVIDSVVLSTGESVFDQTISILTVYRHHNNSIVLMPHS